MSTDQPDNEKSKHSGQKMQTAVAARTLQMYSYWRLDMATELKHRGIKKSAIQILLTDEVSTDLEGLEEYVQKLVQAQIENKVESGELVRPKALETLKTRLLEAEKRIQGLQNHQPGMGSVSNEMFGSKRYTAGVSAGATVGFTACVSVPDLVNLGDKHTIIFDSVITNTGGAYHSHTGVFIAPFKGLYAFQLSAMSSPNKAQYLAFVKDGSVISHAFPDAIATQTYQTAGSQWVVELDQGSEVWIQTHTAGEIHGNCFTMFSGFLLSEME